MIVSNCIKKLKSIIEKKIAEQKYEEALSAARVLSEIYYEYNQIYSDSELEDKLEIIKDNILKKEEYVVNSDFVLFYDGFGRDLRGWAASYIRALTSLGYYIVYICPSKAKGKIPHIISEFNKERHKVIYLNSACNNIDKAIFLDRIFKEYKPKAAFFYTTPSDVSATIAFSNNVSTKRYQIDLTDHAFWIGINAFDYITESREMGASIALYERGITKEKILKLDCVPYINRDEYNVSLPFDIENEEYIFTGGWLYKTLGDENLYYYKTINYILMNYPSLKFLYAGQGDDSEMRKIISKYPGRAYLIEERPDFFRIMEKCKLYINSYPMFGGLMMRYAALAHKVPITLRHDNDADGILFNQDQLGIEFDNYDNYIFEIDRLLSDKEYRKTKENRVGDSVLSEQRFAENLRMLIEEYRTEFQFDKIERFDTTRFRKEYLNRYKTNYLYKTIASKQNIIIFKYFPIEVAMGIMIKIKERLLK